MPTFNDVYLSSAFGYSGRVPFSSTSVAYCFPLIDSSLISISNGVTGQTANYNPTADLRFPILFQLTTSAAVRLRQRTIHPSVGAVNDTTALFTLATGSCGFTDVPAATDAIRHLTLPSANIGDGTSSLSARFFDTIRTGSYGAYVPANVTFPIVVRSYRDCWIQIIARDSAGTSTSGEAIFSCVSDLNIVGY